MNSFYKIIRNLIAEDTNSSHFSFKIVDPTAIGENPVRELSLDVVSIDETSSIVTLAWKDSAEKILEKTTSTQEANHLAELISTDLAQVVKLTSEDNYAEAKKVMENVLKTYLETTDTPVSTNMPKLHNTQASVEKVADAEIAFERAVDHLDNKLMKGLIHQEEYDAEYAKLKKEMFPKEASLDDKLWKISKITMQNLWFSNTDELLEYQEKQKGAKSTQDHIPLWDAEHGKDPAKEKDTLSPASLSYEDVQNEKERDHEDMQKHIDETIKNKLESAMQEKAASVFGPDQVELVQVLRKNGRNWDEVKRILVKEFGFDKDATTIFVDEQRQGSDPTGIEVEPVKEEPESLRPPKELVPDSVHEKLLQDHEDKKKVDSPIEDKAPDFTPENIMDIPEDKEIEKVESSKKCPKCGEDVWDVSTVDQRLNKCWNCGTRFDNPDKESALSNEITRADNDDIHKVASSQFFMKEEEPGVWIVLSKATKNGPKQFDDFVEFRGARWAAERKLESLRNKEHKQASLKTAAPTDLNPLQEPLTEKTTTPSVPSQDRIPFGQSDSHRAPKPESWVIVKTDLKGELPAFRGKFISEKTESDGSKWGIVDKDGELLEVEMNRITPETEGSGAQEAEPAMEPIIEQQQPDEAIPTAPKMDDFHTSSQEDFLAIKVEAEALLKTAEIWNLESPDEEFAAHDLSNLANQALEGDTSLQEYLQTLWGGESWESIQKRLQAEGSTWYVWWMDGVHAYMRDQAEVNKESHKISYMFVKKGLEKHADDSAFEGNGWCRVWVQEDELESDTRYPEILKLADEETRIIALKGLARDLAHQALRLADSAGAKVGVQSWFDSLTPSDHDRIDWVRLATPQAAESSQKPVVEKESSGVEDVMRGQAGNRGIGKVWIKDNFDGEVMSYSSHFADKAEFDKWVASKIEGSTTKEIVKSEFPVAAAKKASDFEKGISQNKTSADPVEAPKTQFKDYKITPKYTPKEQAVPATPEMDDVLSKIDSLQSNLATLETARKQIQAKMKEELTKIDEQGERAQLEAALQESIEKAGVLISAMDNKVVQYKDKLYTLQTEQVDLVPGLTLTDWLEKFKKRFDEAEKFIADVKNGMLSQAKRVVEKTLIRWPNKKSSIDKEASMLDDLNHYNEELLEALKLLSQPLE